MISRLGPWLLASMLAAGAAAPRQVALEVSACASLEEPALRRMVRVEIGDLLLGPGERPPAQVDRARVTCHDAQVIVEASGAGREHLRRSLQLEGFPTDAWPRAVALATIELLATLSPDVRQRLQANEAPAQTRRLFRVLASGVRRAFVSDRGLAGWGAGVEVEGDVGRASLSWDLDFAAGRTPASLGDVTTRLLSTSVAAGTGLESGAFALRGGLGLRGGIAWLTGEPEDFAVVIGRKVTRPWAGPFAGVRLLWGRGSICTALGVEAGYALLRARGLEAGTTAAAASGPWLAITLGAGLQR